MVSAVKNEYINSKSKNERIDHFLIKLKAPSMNYIK